MNGFDGMSERELLVRVATDLKHMVQNFKEVKEQNDNDHYSITRRLDRLDGKIWKICVALAFTAGSFGIGFGVMGGLS